MIFSNQASILGGCQITFLRKKEKREAYKHVIGFFSILDRYVLLLETVYTQKQFKFSILHLEYRMHERIFLCQNYAVFVVTAHILVLFMVL